MTADWITNGMVIALALLCIIQLNQSNAFVSAFVAVSSTTSRNPGRTRRLFAQKTAIVTGATGYIGKSVVRESVQQGYTTYALVRDASKVKDNNSYTEYFKGAQIVECDVTNINELTKTFLEIQNSSSSNTIDAVVSCLASRSGVKKEAFEIDYQATLNCLDAARGCNTGHFVLLSAFCVRKPLLQFQLAKLKFEAALRKQSDVPYTIVRPTAFFKSVSGQLDVVQSGKPFIIFGQRGAVTRCNPIAEADLATYLMDSVVLPERRNKIINLGGPDDPITKKAQGNMLFEATGMEPKFFYVPLFIFDVIIDVSQFLADITGSVTFEDAAEIGRISKYYAIEDMLTTEDNEKYGTVTLMDHYRRIAKEGQEFDPYVTTSGAVLATFGSSSTTSDDNTKNNNNSKTPVKVGAAPVLTPVAYNRENDGIVE